MSQSIGFLTELRTKDRTRGFAKRYKLDAQGSIVKGLPIKTPWNSHHLRVVHFSSLEELRDNLRAGLNDPSRAFTQLSEPTEAALTSNKAGRGVRRLANKQEDGTDPTLKRAPSSLICLDIDDLPLLESETLEQGVKRLRDTLLHPIFKGVRLLAQYSSSCKLTDHGHLKAHLFIELERPLDAETIKDICKAGPRAPDHISKNGTVLKRWFCDLALFNTPQLIYTTAPICAGELEDPMTPSERVQIIEGPRPKVPVTERFLTDFRAQISPPTEEERAREKRTRKGARRTQRAPDVLFSMILENYPNTSPSGAFDELIEEIKENCEALTRGKRAEIQKGVRRACELIREREVGAQEAYDRLNQLAQELRPDTPDHYHKLITHQFQAHIIQPQVEPLDVAVDYIPSEDKDITQVTSETTQRALDVVRETQKLGVLKLPTGAGKTTEIIKRALELCKKQPVILALPTNDLADEVARRAKELDEEISGDTPWAHPVLRHESQSYQCDWIQQDPHYRELYNQLSLSLSSQSSQSLCRVINCARDGKCPAQIPEKTRLSRSLHIMTHALANQISTDRLSDETLMIYDEEPTQLFEDSYEWRALETITTKAPEDIAMLVREVCAIIVEVETKRARKPEDEGALEGRSDEIDLKDILSTPAPHLKLLARAILDAEDLDLETANAAEVLEGLRTGLEQNHILPKHKTLIKRICKALLGELEGSLYYVKRTYLDPPTRSISYHTHWKTRESEGKPLQTLIMSATPSPELEHIARLNKRTLDIIEPQEDSINGQLTEAHFEETGCLNAYKLFVPKRSVFRDNKHGSIARIARLIRKQLENIEEGAQVAVFSSKKLRRALESGEEKSYQQRAQMLSISEVLEPYKVNYGHFFNESVGSNLYENCKALIILGEPATEHTALRLRYHALGLDPQGDERGFKEYRRKLAQAEMEQVIGRARTLRRAGVKIVFAAKTQPNWSSHGGFRVTFNSISGREKSDETQNEIERIKALLDIGVEIHSTDINAGCDRQKRKILKYIAEDARVKLSKEGGKNTLSIQPELLEEAIERARGYIESERRALKIEKAPDTTNGSQVQKIVEELSKKINKIGILCLNDELSVYRDDEVGHEEVKEALEEVRKQEGWSAGSLEGKRFYMINPPKRYESPLLDLYRLFLDQKNSVPLEVTRARGTLFHELRQLLPTLSAFLVKIEQDKMIDDFRAENFRRLSAM